MDGICQAYKVISGVLEDLIDVIQALFLQYTSHSSVPHIRKFIQLGYFIRLRKGKSKSPR